MCGGEKACTTRWLSTGAADPARRSVLTAHAPPVELPDLRLRREMRAAGYRDDELRRLLRSGALSSVGRGAYVAGAPPDSRRDRHILRIRAELAHLSDGAVVSHASAAALHGLPTWAIPLERVQVTRRRRSGGRTNGEVHLRTAPLDANEVTEVAGLPVTSVPRTVVDLARTLPFEVAVAVADAALHAVHEEPDLLSERYAALADAVARVAGWPGSPAARRVVAFADHRSASVGESRSRVAIQRAGLPTPVLQWPVHGRNGLWIADVDFGWPGMRTVGEFDGKIKYGRLLRPGQSAGDAVYAEKVREDALRAENLGVVRWGWDAFADFAPIAARIHANFRPA
jgi:predicted transcriptional regulator of viral defense system